jgi:microcystin-dependent protein
MPAHDHVVRASDAPGEQPSPEGNVWAASGASGGLSLRARISRTIGAWHGAYARREPNVAMGKGAIAEAGGDQAHNNMPPFLGIHFIIATHGIFPSRS